jgi:biotin operon repressor
VSRRRRVTASDLPGLAGSWALRKLWKWRGVLIPIWLAIGLSAIGTVLNGLWPTWWPAPISLALLAAAVIWFAGEHLSGPWRNVWLWLVPSALDDGRRGVLDRPTERAYLAVLLTLCGAWLSRLVQDGWSDPLWYALLAGVLVLGAPWWWHRRLRRSVNRFVRRWPAIAERIKGFEKSTVRLLADQSTRKVTVLSVKLAPTKTIEDVGTTLLPLASGFGLRGGACTLAKDPNSARHVTLRIVPRNPWSKRIAHPCPPIGSLDLTDEDVTVGSGVLDDATEQRMALLHCTGVIGQRGSGKSGMIESLLMWITAAEPRHYALLGIDMAHLATLGVWQPAFAYPIAGTIDAARRLLQGLFALGEYREEQLSARKMADPTYGNILQIGAEFPVVFVPIDELPALVVQGGSSVITVLGQIAQRFRKVNIFLIPAGQNPTEHDFGSTEFRAQLENIIGLFLDARQSQTLWGAETKSGWASNHLAPFTHLLHSRVGHTLPRVAQGYYVSPRMRARRLGELAHLGDRGMLDTGSMAALVGHTNPGIDDGKSGTTVAPPEAPVLHAVPALPTRSPTGADLDERVLRKLPERHQGSVGATALATQLGVSRDAVNRALGRLRITGHAVKVNREWALSPTQRVDNR